MPSSYYSRLQKAVSEYEKAVNEVLRSLFYRLIWDIIVIVVIPVALIVVAYFFSNVAGLLTTLGLAGLNAEERLRRGETILNKYWGDRSRFKRSVQVLKFKLARVDPSDNTGLQEIDNLLTKCFEALP